ncbi:FMN-binding negative transcriptional regulator [Pedobacter metabolipauper]|uniref:PaiB family negative transcriptional regulator n=1 Tax=Pedobacter metabolipauper TaxID=425513 RepID=A0A4V3D1J2_9SPHI|nr:FMN-binding negative transcriptional regulator [Pedobacter metabolipauper]TDQ11363.1 PaiB family negative transcriptional regulator [Pedobacter metabolipauper]
MYISKINLATDEEEIIDFISTYSFATIITAKGEHPDASHLPFVTSRRDGKTILTSHFAKANPQWSALTDSEVLVVFAEPHAYISTKHYDKEQSVPTWNYVAVHAYGKATLVTAQEQALAIIEQTINYYEAGYMDQWNNLSMEFKTKMLHGIVAFEIEVTSFQASKKLSQNKTEAEKQRIIQALNGSDYDVERQLAGYMEKEMKKS